MYHGLESNTVIFVPFPQLKPWQKIQQKVIRELEKKFSGKHVVILAQVPIASVYALTFKPHTAFDQASKFINASSENHSILAPHLAQANP